MAQLSLESNQAVIRQAEASGLRLSNAVMNPLNITRNLSKTRLQAL